MEISPFSQLVMCFFAGLGASPWLMVFYLFSMREIARVERAPEGTEEDLIAGVVLPYVALAGIVSLLLGGLIFPSIGFAQSVTFSGIDLSTSDMVTTGLNFFTALDDLVILIGGLSLGLWLFRAIAEGIKAIG